MEPKQLRQDKAFHKKVQASWKDEAEGNIEVESAATKTSGRKGRVDILVCDNDKTMSVVELKDLTGTG